MYGSPKTARARSKIRSLLRNPDLATPLLARAPHVLGLYAWDTAADLTLAGIESLVPR